MGGLEAYLAAILGTVLAGGIFWLVGWLFFKFVQKDLTLGLSGLRGSKNSARRTDSTPSRRLPISPGMSWRVRTGRPSGLIAPCQPSLPPPAHAAADARLRLCALANVATNLSVPRTSSPSRR
jgi:hypothetical protein